MINSNTKKFKKSFVFSKMHLYDLVIPREFYLSIYTVEESHSFINLAPELLSSFTKSPFEWTATLLFRVLKNSSIGQNSGE